MQNEKPDWPSQSVKLCIVPQASKFYPIAHARNKHQEAHTLPFSSWQVGGWHKHCLIKLGLLFKSSPSVGLNWHEVAELFHLFYALWGQFFWYGLCLIYPCSIVIRPSYLLTRMDNDKLGVPQSEWAVPPIPDRSEACHYWNALRYLRNSNVS